MMNKVEGHIKTSITVCIIVLWACITVGTWWFLGPETFWQRFFGVIVVGIFSCCTAAGGFALGVFAFSEVDENIRKADRKAAAKEIDQRSYNIYESDGSSRDDDDENEGLVG